MYTEKELQLIYAALVNYGDSLATMAKKVSNEKDILSKLSDRANDAWELAVKTTKNMKNED